MEGMDQQLELNCCKVLSTSHLLVVLEKPQRRLQPELVFPPSPFPSEQRRQSLLCTKAAGEGRTGVKVQAACPLTLFPHNTSAVVDEPSLWHGGHNDVVHSSEP